MDIRIQGKNIRVPVVKIVVYFSAFLVLLLASPAIFKAYNGLTKTGDIVWNTAKFLLLFNVLAVAAYFIGRALDNLDLLIERRHERLIKKGDD